MRILVVAAARPNFMKVAPVMRALERRGVEVVLVHTGQHHDERMSDAFFDDLDIRPPDHRLHCGGGSHAVQTAAVMTAFEPLLEEIDPYCVVVCGDVNSTLACTLVAAKAGVPVAHVESGLRSRDRSMPEEINRIAVDHLSDWLLTPSEDADDNLCNEGLDGSRIWRVGNVMVDTLLHSLDRSADSDVLERLGVPHGGHVLWTMHRPSNVDDHEVLAGLVRTALTISLERTVVFPVHPRTGMHLEATGLMRELEAAPGIVLAPALGYLDFLRLQATASVVLTDSGGVQEETTVLGVPCLTLRHSTERPVTVTHGTNTVVGTDPDVILAAFRAVDPTVEARRPEGWDGMAAERIAAVLTTIAPPLAIERTGAAPVPVQLDRRVAEPALLRQHRRRAQVQVEAAEQGSALDAAV
ncbi:MAG: UDP-N-acetylglucosamine 2-epimerase (non-hydrolyzing) [Frankiales bacterium]|nr:MAG: UDP-N-acetylglucosamine 2-epimerase (non-hydrolyzing) [Frankiales bacterium]